MIYKPKYPEMDLHNERAEGCTSLNFWDEECYKMSHVDKI